MPMRPFPVLAAGPTAARIRPGLAAGEPVLSLPQRLPDETRELLSAGERFSLDADGSLVAGPIPCEAGTFHCLLRQTRDGHAVDTAIVVDVAARNAGAVWQGVGQGMRLVEDYTGGSARAMLSRSGHHANRAFRRFRVVLPVFATDGRPRIDMLFDGPRAEMRFQVGLEYPYQQRAEGIPPRIPVTFEGARVATYRRRDWNEAVGHIVSDPVELPFEIPARAKFGLWTTVELPAGNYQSALPYSWTGSNHLQRFGGAHLSSSSLIDGVETALTAPAISPFGNKAAGTANFFTPAMLLVEGEDVRDCFVIIGDSIGKGAGSGGPGSEGFGDVQGDREGNFGILDRALFHDLQSDFVNLARGSDGNKYFYLPDAGRYRLALRRLAGPTATINQNGHNDIAEAVVMPPWRANVEQRAGDSAIVPGAGLYAVLSAGLSGTTAPSGGGRQGMTGEASWIRLSEDMSGERQRLLIQIARMAAVNTLLKRELPDDPLIGFCVTPDADSADKTWTNGEQTPRPGWGDASSRRGRWNAYIRKLDPLISLDAFIDVNQTLEDRYPEESSRWDYAAGRLPIDGAHPNGHGEERARGPVAQALRPFLRRRR